MGSIWTTEKGNEDPRQADTSDLNATHKQLELQDAALSNATDNLQDHEQPRPISIEELKSGEFYDIQSKDPSPRVLGALLLEQLPNNRAKLMFLSSSDFYHFTALDTEILLGRRTLQVEIIQLYTMYPYQAFTHQPTTILQWPKQHDGEELISQISEEMIKTVRDGRWVFDLPHFLEGYLHIYLSYINNKDNYLRRTELVDLWFDFMESYFSVLRDHILRVKPLSRETIGRLLKAIEGMDQMSEMSCKFRIGTLNSSFKEKEKTLKNRKNSFFDSYRPRVLSSGVFDQFWKCITHEYHQDLAILQRQEPLSLGDLFVHLPKITEILNHYQYIVKDLINFTFPELRPKESLRLKLRIAAATDSFDLAEALFTQSGVSSEEICLVILDEELLDSILRSSSERMKTFVMIRTEFFSFVQAYSKRTDIRGIKFFCAFQNLTYQITLEDWCSVSSAIKQNIVANMYRYLNMNPMQNYSLIKRLLEVCLQHKMRAKLLRKLLPCVDYGHLVFPALIEMSSHPKCRNLMIDYFRPEAWHVDFNNPRVIERVLNFLKSLTSRIELEDWEFITFVTKNKNLRPALRHSLLSDQELYENVKTVVNTALEHNMSSELLRNLLPCVDYGHLVFPALVDMFSRPHCREMMIDYFRPEAWHVDFNNPRVIERVLNFLKSLAARIALEDWEFITFVIQNITLRPALRHSLLSDQELYESVKAIVNTALERNMSSELLRNLLPCSDYGYLVFLALVELVSPLQCREVLIDYFRHQDFHTVICTSNIIIKCFKLLTACIAVEDWEFVNFTIQNQILRPNQPYSYLESPEVYENVKELVTVVLEHNMSSGLLRNLLPCEDYCELVFPALVDMSSHPKCRDMMIEYFRNEQDQDILIKLLKLLTTRIALEDWEFVTLIITKQILRMTENYSLQISQEMRENVNELVNVALEHNMRAELLRDLLPCEEYDDLVFTAFIEMFLHPKRREVAVAYLRHRQLHTVECASDMNIELLKLLIARIALEDWELVNFIAQNEILRPTKPYYFLGSPVVDENVAELVSVALKHNMCPELLRNLLPCVDYGELVFPALIEMFSHPKCREVMINYFRGEQFVICIGASNKIIEFLKLLTSRIEVEDWELVNVLMQTHTLSLANSDSVDQVMYENVKELVSVSLEHKMNTKVLKDLLPCANNGHFVFPALVEMFSHPKCGDVMIDYFSPKAWHADAGNPRVKQRILNFLRSLAARIALEDWEFVNFIAQHDTLRPAMGHSLLNDNELYENVKNIVNAVLEHNMSSELFQYLLPYDDYGTLVFPALVEKFSHPTCREVVITYFRYQELQTVRYIPDMIIKLLKMLIAAIALEDWEFVNFIAKNKILRPTERHYFQENLKGYNNVTILVTAALEHKMSVKLLIDLLPCEDYGHMVFPALVEGFEFPHSRVMMLSYFKYISNTRIKYYWDKDRLCSFLKGLTTRVAAEDWEILTFVNRFQTFTVPELLSLVNGQQVHKAVQVFVRVALEHNMSGELLRDLLPCKDYGNHVLETFAKGFSRARSFRRMVSYYGSELQCIEFARGMVQSRKRGKKDVNERIAEYLQSEEVDLWYVFGGSVQIQFIWMRQSLSGFIKRLSPALTREVSSYLA